LDHQILNIELSGSKPRRTFGWLWSNDHGGQGHVRACARLPAPEEARVQRGVERGARRRRRATVPSAEAGANAARHAAEKDSGMSNRDIALTLDYYMKNLKILGKGQSGLVGIERVVQEL
jgi:hypothetical protein